MSYLRSSSLLLADFTFKNYGAKKKKKAIETGTEWIHLNYTE